MTGRNPGLLDAGWPEGEELRPNWLCLDVAFGSFLKPQPPSFLRLGGGHVGFGGFYTEATLGGYKTIICRRDPYDHDKQPDLAT